MSNENGGNVSHGSNVEDLCSRLNIVRGWFGCGQGRATPLLPRGFVAGISVFTLHTSHHDDASNSFRSLLNALPVSELDEWRKVKIHE